MSIRDLEALQEIKGKIDSIEELAHHLTTLGEGVPVIEQNVRCILSAVYVLKLGISDIVTVCQAAGDSTQAK